jgi:hypothetical protein
MENWPVETGKLAFGIYTAWLWACCSRFVTRWIVCEVVLVV